MIRLNIVKNPKDLVESTRTLFSGIVAFFTIVLISVFPLYYENHYFDILKAKYSFCGYFYHSVRLSF